MAHRRVPVFVMSTTQDGMMVIRYLERAHAARIHCTVMRNNVWHQQPQAHQSASQVGGARNLDEQECPANSILNLLQGVFDVFHHVRYSVTS
jgi:hypothetical protein